MLSNKIAELDELFVNTIRFLSIDQVESARSGHPGAPMGLAAAAFALWHRVMRHNPDDPNWINRDRFVLSAGHASALLYSLLHLFGYGISIDDLKRFRQWGSVTPGHPERDLGRGIETTTGPLGQGFANGVGMAMSENWLASNYNEPSHEIIDHNTYVIASDGDMQEGITSEAASLAGTLGLGKLIVLYDSNQISIEGDTNLTFTENVGDRFRSYGWDVLGPINGMKVDDVAEALVLAREKQDRPTLIICNTEIGYGSPNKRGKASAHGEPLGKEEVERTKVELGWELNPFQVPEMVFDHADIASARGKHLQQEWVELYASYKSSFGDKAAEFERTLAGGIPKDLSQILLNEYEPGLNPTATRSASGSVMNVISSIIPSFVGGSADLGPSTKTTLNNKEDITKENPGGNNIHFGVREHAMGAVANGMALHGGIIPYTATFLTFYDYMRPAVRLGALMGLHVIYIFSHDSIGLGEDGPTHQPIEHIVGMRAVPNLTVIRPADSLETMHAWDHAINESGGPTALILSRQNLPQIQRNFQVQENNISKGAYIVYQSEMTRAPDVILIATGSEVHVAVDSAIELEDKEINIRVVSMPSWEIFDAQEINYKDFILPPKIKNRISVEAGSTLGWSKYVGLDGISIGIDEFGASAPGNKVLFEFGFHSKYIISKIMEILKI